MRHILDTVQGDLLEFDLVFEDETGQEFQPVEGDKYFFEVEIPNAENIDLEQTENHFRIERVNLIPGNYPFAAGVIFANGDRLTVLKKQSNILRVLEAVVEDDAE